MALPLFMIYGLQLRTSQKIVLGGALSLGFVVAIFDILRTVESLAAGTFSGVALWSSLEVTIAVIVSSLPLYRVLITSKGRRNLVTRFSVDHSKRTETSRTGSERNLFDIKGSPTKPSISTFREDLETQDSELFKYCGGTQQVPLAKIVR